MKYRPLITGPSAPWVDEDDLPDDNGATTIDQIAAVLADNLYRRADRLRHKPDWSLLQEELRVQVAGAAVRNELSEQLQLQDMLVELMNMRYEEPPKMLPSVPDPLPWDDEEGSKTEE